MIEALPFRRPVASSARFFRDPLGLLMLLGVILVLNYGGMNKQNSPVYIPFFETLYGTVFSGVEIVVLALPFLAAIRRIVARDYRIDPSPITRHVLVFGVVMAVIPLFRLFIQDGLWIPFEVFFIPFFVAMFFVWRLVFDRYDLRVMVWLVVIGGLYKSMEGLLLFVINGMSWSLLSYWRDGLVLVMMVMGTMLAWAIKPEKGKEEWYRRLRKTVLLLAPLTTLIFVGALRRSFFLAIPFAMFFLLLWMQGRERGKILRGFLAISVVMFGAMVFFGLDKFADRATGIASPTEEGSASWRLIEYYNVGRMILEQPIVGYPFGVEFINYTNVELPKINGFIPHNVYLYVLLRGGVIGLAVFFWFMFAVFRMHRRTVLAAQTPGERFVALWMACSTIILLVAGLTMPVFADRIVYVYPFFLTITAFLRGAFPEPKPVEPAVTNSSLAPVSRM